MTTRRNEEADIQSAIVADAQMLGYLVYHTYDSRRCVPGFPDLVIVGYGHLIVLEIKTDRGRVSEAQRQWMTQLSAAGVDVRLYRTSEWRTLDLHHELVALRRLARSRRPVVEEPLNLAAVELRYERYQRMPHAAKAIALVDDVPALLRRIGELEERLKCVEWVKQQK